MAYERRNRFKKPKSTRPDNAVLAKRKRDRRKEMEANDPRFIERRLRERNRQANRKNARRRVRSKGRM